MDDKFYGAVLLAVIGYLAKYINDMKVAKRKDKLDRINRQLKEFYGPLFSLTSSSLSSWTKFRQTYRPDTGAYFDKKTPPTENEKEVWRLWMTTIFFPINERIYRIITEHGDLIIENKFPKCFLDFCAHVETYRPVAKKWDSKDYTDHLALINYPNEIVSYVEKSYNNLKCEQQKLLT